MFSKQWFRLSFLAILISLLITGCGSAPSDGILVWIDVPMDGLAFPKVQAVNIEGHASGSDGVSHVELYINGDPEAYTFDHQTRTVLERLVFRDVNYRHDPIRNCLNYHYNQISF